MQRNKGQFTSSKSNNEDSTSIVSSWGLDQSWGADGNGPQIQEIDYTGVPVADTGVPAAAAATPVRCTHLRFVSSTQTMGHDAERRSPVREYDLSSLTFLRCSGAPLGEDVAHKFREKFPNVQIVNGYGLTETGGVVASLKGPNEIKRFDSVGRLSEFMEAKIVDPITAEPLLPGQKGELWLRGPAIMKGYVGDDKATAEILDSEGWLKTGDLCYFDSQAFLFIVDRLKELIKYKAYQVPPAELEHLLQTNPEIIDAAVIPYPDEETGQVPMAFVVRKTGSQITEVQVPPYKRIRRVAFVNSIPKSSAGKILRKQLVDHALSATLFN
ncbi:hypothetical protein LWI29_014455 [Acer saccharum]|uniref:Uncharacterized protein n=1 Tax=Acer saccharum TaxID=4024 RepID=A0AA39SVK3_ACESA|nr:hypothetical protein LWI29_014455 [Acer saccharum]